MPYIDTEPISDNQAEAAVIATLICHPKFILYTDYLKPNYFYNGENGYIFWAIRELSKKGVETIDAVNIMNMINSNPSAKKKIEEYNLMSMQEFIDMSKLAARHTLEEYKLQVNTVVTLSYKRDLNRILSELQSQCHNSAADLKAINEAVNKKISRLTEQYLIANEIEMIGDVIDDLWDEIVRGRNEEGIYGIPSKFQLLNEYFTYEKTELVLLAARMKEGKSMFFMNECLYQLQHGIPVLYLDTEMSTKTFLNRALANLTGIRVKDIKEGRYSSKEEERIAEARAFLKNSPFVHMYLPQVSQEEIYSICKILKYKMNLQMVIYDYIKADMPSSSEQYNMLGIMTNFLKNTIAGELDLAVLAGAQKNRNGEIADSDKIARYVSSVIDWRPKTSNEIIQDCGLDYGNFAMSIPINRNGSQTGEDEYISMHFNGDFARIEQAIQPQRILTPQSHPFE